MSVKPWPPTRSSAALAVDHPSLFERYCAAFRIAWEAAMGYRLEDWQEALLHAATELFPEGHERAGELRYRQVLVSLARQNGKSEIAAALGLLWMLAFRAPLVIGIASSAEQARLVYVRAMQVIRGSKALRARFEALTETRGIRAKDGGLWELKASKSAALQGLPISLAVVDEVHLVKRDLWHDLVAGTGGRPDTLVVGITTAGDSGSVLLKDLYEDAENGRERFGSFIWESPDAHVPDDDGELLDYLKAANPALASGRLDAGNVLADVRAMPPQDAIRYRLNRFVTASSSFIAPSLWAACARPNGIEFPAGTPVFTIDRTPDWGYATITATVKAEDGIHTEVAASIVSPSLERLERTCVELAAHSPAWFVVDGYSLKDLGERLKRRGLPVQSLRLVDVVSASALFYALTKQQKIRHSSDPLLTRQIPATGRKSVGNGFRITRADSASEIDAVMATAMGAYVAETVPARESQLFL